MSNINEKSVFQVLSEVEVKNKVRQKGNFWYVSWSNAVREMLKRYPLANWEFTQYDGLPFLKTQAGCFVECAVTIEGVTRKQMMPILNFKNQTEFEPDAAQVNKSQMRALTKAIALHGFGLDLWAGEDLDGFDEQYEESKIECSNPIDSIKKSITKDGKVESDFFSWASKVVSRDIISFDDLSEQELQHFANKLEGKK